MLAMPLGLAAVMTLEELTITHDARPRIMTGTHEDGGVGVTFLDPDERPWVATGTDDEDESGIVILDARQAPEIANGSEPQGSGLVLTAATLAEIQSPYPKRRRRFTLTHTPPTRYGRAGRSRKGECEVFHQKRSGRGVRSLLIG